MQIPLNIDFQQIFLHLFNFVLLAGGLYLLLYKPVKNFMDGRMDEYNNKEKEIGDRISEAEELKKEYEKRLENAEAEASDIILKASKEAQKLTAERMAEAKRREERIIDEAKASAELCKKRALEETKEEIVELAVGMAKKILQGEDISNGGK